MTDNAKELLEELKTLINKILLDLVAENEDLEERLENKGDLISRQSVLEAIEEDNRNGHYSCFASNNDAQCFKQVINELPSTENKERWIPVSERLPRIADVYRVTRYYLNNVMNPIYLVDACCFDGFDTWYDDNRINHDRAYVDNVIAWQENPEPYKPER